MHSLFRNDGDVEKLKDILLRIGLKVASFDGDTVENSEILSALNEFERQRVGERLTAGRAAARAREGFCGGSEPYGYRRRSDGKEVSLEQNDAEQEIIKIASELRGDHSLREICSRLDYLGYRNRSGRPWHPQTISRILART